MKVFGWFILIPVLTGIFYFGLSQGKKNASGERLSSELMLCMLITQRDGALTREGKEYMNQLIDMNVHSYLMSGQGTLSSEDQLVIESTISRLLKWKMQNGFEFWSPVPVADEGSGFDMPGGSAGGAQDLIKEYELYREKLDAFLEEKHSEIERFRAGMKQLAPAGE